MGRPVDYLTLIRQCRCGMGGTKHYRIRSRLSPPPFGGIGASLARLLVVGRRPTHHHHTLPSKRLATAVGLPPRLLELQYLQPACILLFPSAGRSNLCVQRLGSIMKRNDAPRRAPELNAAERGTADVRMPCFPRMVVRVVR